MPRGFNEHEKDAIRQSLLDVGRAKLISVGMHKTSVEELARAAHISKGAFYQFFPSKEALFITLFAEGERAYRYQLRAFAQRPGRTPKARLLAFFRDALHCYRDTPLLSRFSRDDLHALLRTLQPEGMRASIIDDEVFITEIFNIWRGSGVKLKCTAMQFSAVLQVLFFTDLDVQDLDDTYAAAVDLILEALAEKLTA